MAKVVGSYASVTRGVSEQVPQDRHPGQMWEQVNMISDPVVGLARRPGSVFMDSINLSAGDTITPLMKSDIRLYREYSFFHLGKEYSLIYRSGAAQAPTALPAFICYCKTDSKFLKVVYADKDAALAPWINGGISALTTVGDYMALAANTLGPGYSVTDKFAATQTQGVAWIRGGAYSRTYTLKITRNGDNRQFAVSYTTLASSYPNLLDTSDIPVSGNDQYQKQVNDRVNAYNSAVNKWIGDAQKSITPQNIAANLMASLQAQGYVNIGQVGGAIFMDQITSLSCDDGGDGTLFRGVLNELDDVSKLSSVHSNGKVVRIKANNQVDPYYMVFQTDDGSYYSTGKWVEGPAQIIQPGQVFAVAGITADGGSFVIGSSPAVVNASGNGLAIPKFEGSICGDQNQTGAIPYFFGRKISLLTMFQDRLVVVADGTIFMSRTGDYFNWFRRTMLSVQDDDPIQVYALGASDDVISKCVTYNKNLFMFGMRNQYAIPGSVSATPQGLSISTVASERDSMYCQPVTSGNLIFYGASQAGTGDSMYSGIINQFQLGLYQDTPETYQVSKQLAKYIRGRPVEMATISAPSTLFLRTDGLDNGFYVYSYIDAAGSQTREVDSWGRWECSSALGQVAAITSFQQSLLSFWIGLDAAPGHAANIVMHCNGFSMDTSDRTRPFLDAQAPLNTAGSLVNQQWANWSTASMWSDAYGAIDVSQPEFLIHSTMNQWGSFETQYPKVGSGDLVDAGFDFLSYVTLTSPYVRDDNDKALVNGRLVVNKYSVSFTDSGGVDVLLTDNNGTNRKIAQFNGRLVGHSNNLIGQVPISTTTVNVPVGRANTEHRVTFQSKSCLPMTVSAVEWVGQLFTSGRRV
jgi:hypothetical protein